MKSKIFIGLMLTISSFAAFTDESKPDYKLPTSPSMPAIIAYGGSDNSRLEVVCDECKSKSTSAIKDAWTKSKYEQVNLISLRNEALKDKKYNQVIEIEADIYKHMIKNLQLENQLLILELKNKKEDCDLQVSGSPAINGSTGIKSIIKELNNSKNGSSGVAK